MLIVPWIDAPAFHVAAMVAIGALVLEGLFSLSPIAVFFQLVPIFISAFAAYYAWQDGYYLVACMFAISGIVSILAFASVRFLVNIPAICIFFLITRTSLPVDGPKNWIFSLIEIPTSLIELSAIFGISTLVLGVRFSYPRVYVFSATVFAILAALTTSVIFGAVGSALVQRLATIGVGVSLLGAGALYYRYAMAHRAMSAEGYISVKENTALHEELSTFVLDLEQTRKEMGYKPGWLHSTCQESGLIDIYRGLISSGKIVRTSHDTPRHQLPRPPTAAHGLKCDPYELLGIHPGASMDAIKEAYFRQNRLFDSEEGTERSPELERIRKRISAALTVAYGVLTKV